MKKNHIKGTVLTLSVLACNGVSAQNNVAETKKYNVLFIASDDLANAMQTFSNPMVKTPNLERLAQRGVTFNYAHTQFPLSGPSRASLMTGLRPDRTEVFDIYTDFRNNIPDAITLPQLFEKNGYYTARVGKIYHAGVPNDIGLNGTDDAQSWRVRYNPIGKDKTEERNVTNYTPFIPSLGGALCFMSMDNTTDDELTDGMVANTAVMLMRNVVNNRKKKEPFFIAAGFYRPHCPYIAPKKYFDMYPIENIKLPERSATDWDNKPEAAMYNKPLNWGLNEDQQKKILQSYYASVTFMDAQVGKLLDGLDELGIADNTIIVFWSDHGYNLGEHGQWMKQSLFDQATRTPLIISIPGMKANGEKTDSHIEFIDIYPTIAEACGLQCPSGLDGVNLKPMLNDVKTSWDRPAFSMVRRPNTIPGKKVDRYFFGRSVRYENFRYTEWDEGKEGFELYDYSVDPNEFNNLANNKKYAKEQSKLQKMLHDSYKNEKKMP